MLTLTLVLTRMGYMEDRESAAGHPVRRLRDITGGRLGEGLVSVQR